MEGSLTRDLLPGYLAAFFTVVCWSLNFPLLRYALAGYTPWDFTALRLIIAALSVSPFLAVQAARGRLPLGREALLLVGVGLAGVAGGTFLLASGLKTLTAGSGAFVIATVPIFSALLARAFFRELAGAWGWAGILVSVGGVALIAVGEEGRAAVPGGTAFVLGSAFLQAVFYVSQKRFLGSFTPLQVTGLAVGGSAVLALLVTPGLAGRVTAAPLGATLAACYMGAVSLALAFVTWSYALARLKAARVTSTMNVLPLLSLLEAWLWLGELPAPTALLGGLIALAGVIVLGKWGK